MAFLSLLAPATMTFHPGSMVVVVPSLSGPHQLEKSDPGAAPANPVGLARGQEGKKAYCQKSQTLLVPGPPFRRRRLSNMAAPSSAMREYGEEGVSIAM
ncbi:hypothetical protein Q8A67_021256 [Cirrhinus molitorella]|uniref:Uncharacterized protein n=1 Tax=Cirrhinus molitorella TaxID=172907 RepID=A0AA88P6K2_9TELE|nr:hypothetical protein Q8A67_021256 [Cirrhinus molitorella]